MVDVLVAVVLFLWLTYLWENYLSYRQVTVYDKFLNAQNERILLS